MKAFYGSSMIVLIEVVDKMWKGGLKHLSEMCVKNRNVEDNATNNFLTVLQIFLKNVDM
jgi:hypothetical protein